MPQRSFSLQLQSVWDRLRRRRDSQRPRHYAHVATAQRRSQARDGRSHADELRRFGQLLDENRIGDQPAVHAPHVSSHTGDPSDQALIDRSINRPTTLSVSLPKAVKIPVIHCATSQPDAPDEGEEVDSQVWCIPGDESYPQIYTQGRLLNNELFRHGLVGHEDGINLPLMLTALSFAFDHNMSFEIDNLKATINRYIIARMFYHNPHSKFFSLGKEYFEFRSEEIYRAWVAVTNDQRLQGALTPDDLILLYLCMVQYKWWRDLVRGYEYRFNSNLLEEYENFKGDLRGNFEEAFWLFYTRTCFGSHPWMDDISESCLPEDTSERGRHSPTAGPYSTFQPPVGNPDNSDNTERQLRHVRRETSVISETDDLIDLVELYE
ncbi:unnamed protein product [Fusarium graminearum]|nr:hypothetical protein HG531_000637 [Fusarium graminearum]PCD27974.1 hypothetical protein FGRA07_03113 [Fusarium graminearum]CAF3510573.1 unnamed protein product [Fusarium graminearum]CAF3540304.1 unnamed protein product [Fusarium graminearum]CAF3655227.1 unnamed protein product [Fusarium graminearum]